jgi:hypothetical protein
MHAASMSSILKPPSFHAEGTLGEVETTQEKKLPTRGFLDKEMSTDGYRKECRFSNRRFIAMIMGQHYCLQ